MTPESHNLRGAGADNTRAAKVPVRVWDQEHAGQEAEVYRGLVHKQLCVAEPLTGESVRKKRQGPLQSHYPGTPQQASIATGLGHG